MTPENRLFELLNKMAMADHVMDRTAIHRDIVLLLPELLGPADDRRLQRELDGRIAAALVGIENALATIQGAQDVQGQIASARSTVAQAIETMPPDRAGRIARELDALAARQVRECRHGLWRGLCIRAYAWGAVFRAGLRQGLQQR